MRVPMLSAAVNSGASNTTGTCVYRCCLLQLILAHQILPEHACTDAVCCSCAALNTTGTCVYRCCLLQLCRIKYYRNMRLPVLSAAVVPYQILPEHAFAGAVCSSCAASNTTGTCVCRCCLQQLCCIKYYRNMRVPMLSAAVVLHQILPEHACTDAVCSSCAASNSTGTCVYRCCLQQLCCIKYYRNMRVPMLSAAVVLHQILPEHACTDAVCSSCATSNTTGTCVYRCCLQQLCHINRTH